MSLIIGRTPVSATTPKNLANFTWQVADLLRGERFTPREVVELMAGALTRSGVEVP
jgi:hypothetical protein